MKPLGFKCMIRPHLAVCTSPCGWGPGLESGLGHSLGSDPAPAPHLTGGCSECWTVGDLPVPGGTSPGKRYGGLCRPTWNWQGAMGKVTDVL